MPALQLARMAGGMRGSIGVIAVLALLVVPGVAHADFTPGAPSLG